MKLSREDVLKLAKLSRLRLTEDEIIKYQDELSKILDYVEQLDKVDVTDIKPTYQVTGLTSSDPNATREDEVKDQVNQEELLMNAPKIKDGLIQVKRMIG